MNKFKFYFVVISITALLFSCNKDDDSPEPVPVRAFDVQYKTDSTTIAGYLQTHYIVNDISDPNLGDEDIVFAKITEGSKEKPIFDLLDSPTYPKLLVTPDINRHNIKYRIYYLKLRADNETGLNPTRVDQVLTAYSGSSISSTTTTTNGEATTTYDSKTFQTVKFPEGMLSLVQTVSGWGDIFPLFRTGVYDATPSPNPASFTNFGAGVMFLPSGLAYFNNPPSQSSIPSYSPLVFTFKLYDLKRSDLENDSAGDGILSINEDINGNGIFTDDDTDKDGIPDYLDFDDDGDGYLTKNEIKDPITGLTYSFDLIPTCGNSGNGKKRYLDSSCH